MHGPSPGSMSKPNLAPVTIKAAIESRLGPVTAFAPLPEGLVSQVFGFRQGRSRFVARVARSAFGFRKDAFACRAFGRPALPIPEIVGIEAIEAAFLCMSRRARGRRFCDLKGRAKPGGALKTLAELARTDTSATAGFGVFDEHGRAPCPTWRAYLMQVGDERLFDWASVADRLHGVRVGDAIAAIDRLAPTDEPPRGLVHGDLGTANLIGDGRAITAVIDWDRALIGDGAYDEANLFFWAEARLEPVRAHLARRHAADPGWARRMLCYQLRIGIEELYDSAIGRTPVDTAWLATRCADLIEQARDMGG